MKRYLHQKFLYLLIPLFAANIDAYSQTVDFGKSYMNITKGLNGGTIEPGDTLEIRATFVVRVGVFDSCAYYDAVPTGTTYIPGTTRVLTNEGKIYKQFTDAVTDDAGWISGSNIRINLGYNETDLPARSYRRGRIRNTHKPSFGGGSCIMVASFRVVVNAPLGSIINIGAGQMTYKAGTTALQTHTFPTNQVVVYTNIGMCPNLVGSNTLGTEFNGTFGTGKARNRTPSANVPPNYLYTVFNTSTPNDYMYGVANNTSTRVNYSTSNSWAKPDNSSPSHRVFSLWDIIGDHTGAANPILGNPAADTVSNNNGGYMLVVNAAYRIDSAFQHTINGLCPNTYYEISCWIRNICSKCGCDSNGKSATNTSTTPVRYIPTGPGDSSGVKPNLTFEVNGIDYYTTGNIQYTGQWVKKGFTFRTGSTGTVNLKIINNAPGGGGNDWALDDISVATCYPNLVVNPLPLYTTCADNVANFGATVQSYFNNYTYYKWQRSTNGGTIWNDVGVNGTGNPLPVNGQYVYSVNFPPFIATMADSGSKYRLVVATTLTNLSSANCSSASSSNFTTLNIIHCSVLPVQLVAWNVSKGSDGARLKWITEKENEFIAYAVERSTDGVHFTEVARQDGKFLDGTRNIYEMSDPAISSGITYYRLRLLTTGGKVTYSKLITLNITESTFAVQSNDNPFTNKIRTEILMAEKSEVTITLTNSVGSKFYSKKVLLDKGNNLYTLENLTNLVKGMYFLRIESGTNRKVLQLIKH